MLGLGKKVNERDSPRCTGITKFLMNGHYFFIFMRTIHSDLDTHDKFIMRRLNMILRENHKTI